MTVTERAGGVRPSARVAARRLAVVVARAPWSRAAWLDTACLVTGVPVAAVAAAMLVCIAGLALGLVWAVVPAAVLTSTLAGWVPVFSGWQRSRLAAFRGVEITPPPPPGRPEPTLRRMVAAVAEPVLWRQAAYQPLALAVSAAGTAAAGAAWACGLTLGTTCLYGWWLPARSAPGWDLRTPGAIAVMTALGLAALAAAPWLARLFVTADVALAQALLGPSRASQLADRVTALTVTRAGVVDAADAERRRIERDLHDGVQQRLTALAMNLGIARATLTDLPAPARDAIAAGHDAAREALRELRDVVRGLHPAVLTDEGLDAALSGIAARAPLPVQVRVAMPRRASPTVEAVAFFVVSEALTNVARHAHATRATVTVTTTGDRLRVVVEDDGRGGARPDGGTGLRGLAARVAAADGALRLDSPDGGPTTITAELPCG
jgi:signal transduction histidine kinase